MTVKQSAKNDLPNPQKVRIWDLPTRLFHWLFAACVIGAIVTVKAGGDLMQWHLPLGVSALMLLLFRIVWGFTGSRYARFSQFVKCPRTALAYLKQPHKMESPGHNPIGGWSVIALLTVVGIQAVTGLFTSDDILVQGPLYNYVSSSTASLMTTIHKWNEKALFILIALHLVAIVIYAVKGKRLVPPMITGDKSTDTLAPDTPAARDDIGLRAWALVLIILFGSVGVWLVKLAQ